MINSMLEYGSAIASITAKEFAEATAVVHNRQHFDEPNSALCGANEWGTNQPELVTCPDCKARQLHGQQN